MHAFYSICLSWNTSYIQFHAFKMSVCSVSVKLWVLNPLFQNDFLSLCSSGISRVIFCSYSLSHVFIHLFRFHFFFPLREVGRTTLHRSKHKLAPIHCLDWFINSLIYRYKVSGRKSCFAYFIATSSSSLLNLAEFSINRARHNLYTPAAEKWRIEKVQSALYWKGGKFSYFLLYFQKIANLALLN